MRKPSRNLPPPRRSRTPHAPTVRESSRRSWLSWSPDATIRKSTFYDLLKLLPTNESPNSDAGDQTRSSFLAQSTDEAKRVRRALIRLLETENAVIFGPHPNPPDPPPTQAADTSPSEGEDEGDADPYYGELLGFVADLDDDRAIPALVGALTWEGTAERALLKYGDKALPPVLEQLKNPDGSTRSLALSVGVDLLEISKDPASRTRVKEIIRSSLHDSDLNMRRGAIWTLQCLDEREEFVPDIERIAKTDPDKLPGTVLDGGDGGQFYPVRYTARQALKKIETHAEIHNDPMCQNRLPH